MDFISTDEDPGLRIESFAIIKLRGVTTKLNIIYIYLYLVIYLYVWSFTIHNTLKISHLECGYTCHLKCLPQVNM